MTIKKNALGILVFTCFNGNALPPDKDVEVSDSVLIQGNGINNTFKLAKAMEDLNMPNLYPNVDVGHFVITREEPEQLEKLKSRLLHVHLSETESFAHTNSILGTGAVDFKVYVDKHIELGIEENCLKFGEPCVAGIEMGSGASGGFVENPDMWVEESLKYLAKILPNLTR